MGKEKNFSEILSSITPDSKKKKKKGDGEKESKMSDSTVKGKDKGKEIMDRQEKKKEKKRKHKEEKRERKMAKDSARDRKKSGDFGLGTDGAADDKHSLKDDDDSMDLDSPVTSGKANTKAATKRSFDDQESVSVKKPKLANESEKGEKGKETGTPKAPAGATTTSKDKSPVKALSSGNPASEKKSPGFDHNDLDAVFAKLNNDNGNDSETQSSDSEPEKEPIVFKPSSVKKSIEPVVGKKGKDKDPFAATLKEAMRAGIDGAKKLTSDPDIAFIQGQLNYLGSLLVGLPEFNAVKEKFQDAIKEALNEKDDSD